MRKEKLIYSSSLAAITTILFVAAITILAEKVPPLKDWLKNLSGHHWTSKSILSLTVYFVGLGLFYAIPKEINQDAVRKSIHILTISAFLGAAAILLFFTGHYIGIF